MLLGFVYSRIEAIAILAVAVVVADHSAIDDNDGVVIVFRPKIHLFSIGQLVSGDEAGGFADVGFLGPEKELDRTRTYKPKKDT